MMSLLLAALCAGSALAVNNGLALTPQMGWNNWNSLGCDVSQSLLIDTAQVLVHTGLRDVGYDYVVLDDCWSDGRDDTGFLRADRTKFPQGMQWMARQLHEQGLRYGMYSSAGEMTCARYEGSLDHEVADAASFASWEVDYLKYDNCFHRGRFGYPEVSFNRYNAMWQALNATGRPILYSLCNWGEDYVHTWGMSIANSWRISGDVYDSFNRPHVLCSCVDPADPHCVAPGTHCSVMTILNRMAPYADRGSPGGWNDLDMLEVGGGGMTDDEYKAHFSMWAAVKSPLLIGANLRKLSAKTLSILNNPAVIAVNQDPLGRSAIRVSRTTNGVAKDRFGQGELQVWSGPLYPNDQLVVLLNAGAEDLDMSTPLEDVFLSESGGATPRARQDWLVYDLWENRMNDTLAAEVLVAGLSRLKRADWYNSTELPYAAGLDAGDARLLGKLVGQVLGGGEVTAKVPSHGVKMFRLRSKSNGAKDHVTHKEEL